MARPPCSRIDRSRRSRAKVPFRETGIARRQKLPQKQSAPARKPGPMRLGQVSALLACRRSFETAGWPDLAVAQFSEAIQDLVGPEALETMQRLVQRRELVVRDAADLLHRLDVLLIERVDDVADFLALRRQADADRAAIDARTLMIEEAESRPASSGCRRRWSRDSNRACAARRRSVPCRRCCRAAAPAPN